MENDIKSWACTILYDIKQQNGWIELPLGSHIFNNNGTGMVTIKAQLQNDGRTYYHLVLIDCIEGNEVYLTEGRFVLQKILSWDEISGTFYFIGTKENNPNSRHLYSVDLGGRKAIKCLTCDLKVRCSFNLNFYDCFINFYAY